MSGRDRNVDGGTTFSKPRTADGDLLRRLEDDPWSLSAAERARALELCADRNERWLEHVARLVEPPLPGPGFPAFLLETAPFDRLGHAVARALGRRDLDTATADELQRFVDLFGDWLPAPAPLTR